MPLSKRSRMLVWVIFSPFKRISPLSTEVKPLNACTSSSCPFPSIPAIPTISPARTLKLKSLSPKTPLLFFTFRCLVSKTTSPGACGPFSTLKFTSRPTIISAICCVDVSATLTVPIYFPRRNTLHSSATCLISFSLCVISKILFPSLISFCMISIKSSISCGVNTAVGSSKIKMFALR